MSDQPPSPEQQATDAVVHAMVTAIKTIAALAGSGLVDQATIEQSRQTLSEGAAEMPADVIMQLGGAALDPREEPATRRELVLYLEAFAKAGNEHAKSVIEAMNINRRPGCLPRVLRFSPPVLAAFVCCVTRPVSGT